MPPLTLCAYMKKGPNLRWSLIQCSGGDEGDRTPDLLTASQALSQLSYAPVRRSTIRELGRRCKDNFGKTFAAAAADTDAGTGREAPRCPIRPAGRARRAAATPPPPPFRLQSGRRPRSSRHETGPSTTFGLHPPTIPLLAKTKPQVEGSWISRNPRYGHGVGVKRSRWAGFVAGASQTAAEWNLNMSKPVTCRRILLSLKSKKARQHFWPSENPGGPSGIRTQNPGIMSPLR